jgi:hypothetical protein
MVKPLFITLAAIHNDVGPMVALIEEGVHGQ